MSRSRAHGARLVVLGVTLVLFGPAASVAAAQDPRLAARLDKPTAAAVNALIDSARIAKIPTAPLIDKALEGAAKGSDGSKIVVAVRQLSGRMASAKGVLGPATTADEIKAAATALDAGASDRDLARLRVACGKRQVTMPLAVLADLVGHKVAVSTATDLVLQLSRAGTKDADLMLFQRNVRADIDRGADPTVAATTRTRGTIASVAPPTAKPSE